MAAFPTNTAHTKTQARSPSGIGVMWGVTAWLAQLYPRRYVKSPGSFPFSTVCLQGCPRCSVPGRNRGLGGRGRKKEIHSESTQGDGTWRCGCGHERGHGQGGSPSSRPLVLPRGTGYTWWLSSCLGNGLGRNGSDAGVEQG